MTKVFISGGAGFIGSNLVNNLLKEGHEVFSFDQNINYFSPLTKLAITSLNYRYEVLLKGAELISGSTLDIFDLKRAIEKIKPDYIINLAALPLAKKAISLPIHPFLKSEEIEKITETVKKFFN